MASGVPPRKPAHGGKRRSDVDEFLRMLEKLKPDPEFADAVEAAYLRSHGGPPVGRERGPPKRRRSTRTS